MRKSIPHVGRRIERSPPGRVLAGSIAPRSARETAGEKAAPPSRRDVDELLRRPRRPLGGLPVLKKARIVHHAILSPRWKASSMSCVTSTIVVPMRRWITEQVLLRLGADHGIERAERVVHEQRAKASAASARATPTRCCCRPESSCGYLSANSAGSSWKSASRSSTLRLSCARRPPEEVRHRGDVAATVL